MILRTFGNRTKAKFSIPVSKQIIKKMISVLVILLLSGLLAQANSQQLNYTIIRNGTDAGWMKLEKNCIGSTCQLTLNSAIKIRMIVWLYATVFESASFANGKLIFSSQYQKMNGNVKVNQQTRFSGNGYEVTEQNQKKQLAIPDIYFNLLCLYFQEPVAPKKVYCDKLQCYADIEKTKDGGYKVRFPNGNSNVFYYAGGICNKIIIDHTFYSAEVILNKKNLTDESP